MQTDENLDTTDDSCPNDQKLAALLNGVSPDSVVVNIGEHPPICSRLNLRIESVARLDKTILKQLLDPVSTDVTFEEVELLRMEAKAKRIRMSKRDSAIVTDEPTPPPELGTRYTVQKQLGEGGFGAVWLAWDEELKRSVAAKVPHLRRISVAGQTDRYISEARIAARLDHPGIVPVFDVGTTNCGLPFVVSKYIEGFTLSEWVKRNRTEPSIAAALIAAVAEALHHAHEQGVIHRDVKPTNIMIDVQGQPLLMDFGLAKRTTDNAMRTAEGVIVGTPAYMSPEQARSDRQQVDRRSDIYSLGVVFYELLTGNLPFGGETAILIHRLLNEEVLSVPSIGDRRIPRDLETICLKAIAKAPAQRYDTADDLAQDLRRFARREPIHARRASVVWRLRHHLRGYALTTVFAGIAMLSFCLPMTVAPNRGESTMQTIRVITEPPGAISAIIRVDELTNEPIANEVQRPIGTTPLQVKLPPGRYLVEVAIPEYGFHQVYRTVPEPSEVMSATNFRHTMWNRLDDGVIKWPAIQIWKESELLQSLVFFDGGSFIMGREDIPGAPPHNRKVEPFYLEPTEVTVKHYREVIGRLPSQLANRNSPAADDDAVSFVDFNLALEYAELAGRRLPTEAEYEFAATSGGTQRFPWGNAAVQQRAWTLNSVGEPTYDRIATRPPVINLYSNLVEWTDSTQTPYPDPAAPPGLIGLPTEIIKFSRVIRGGPHSVISGEPTPGELQVGPPERYADFMETSGRGLGFRCARSAKLRFLP